MQSILHSQTNDRPVALYPLQSLPWGPVTRQRLTRTLVLYLALAAAGFALANYGDSSPLQKFGLGLVLPGGGYLAEGEPGTPAFWQGFGLFGLWCAGFGLALVLWFATGNVIAAPVIWLAAAVAAAGGDGAVWAPATVLIPALAMSAVMSSAMLAWVFGVVELRKRRALNRSLARQTDIAMPQAKEAQEEIPLADLRLMRVLLDRALQPVDSFDGFEWIDQFQTAAIRYQLNFASYALSMASHNYLPAFDGYILEAQRNLALKQLDHRVWRYWRLENAWGNLNTSADPIPRDNIMLTGFLATQLTLARAASGLTDFDSEGSLPFTHPGGRCYAYSTPQLSDILANQYARAPQGLLACEPNWIYPLCNTITAIGLVSADAQFGASRWRSVSRVFRRALEEEFVTPSGRLVPFRSSLTGLAAPGIGGPVMQAFPCLFINAVLPDLARRQWALARQDLVKPLSSVWPIDVGNYRCSRAAGLAACAAAAVEMGDGETAARLLEALDQAHALTNESGVTHRAGASLWAHAVELMARLNVTDGLRNLATRPRAAPGGLRLHEAPYPDVLVARARSNGDSLDLVLHPSTGRDIHPITVTGLAPGRTYAVRSSGCADHVFEAKPSCRETLNLFLGGRTAIQIAPAGQLT